MVLHGVIVADPIWGLVQGAKYKIFSEIFLLNRLGIRTLLCISLSVTKFCVSFIISTEIFLEKGQ